jgi:hypothetical protein
VDRFFLVVVNVQRRTAVRRDLDDEVVERSAGIRAGDLKDQVATRAGLKTQALPWA